MMKMNEKTQKAEDQGISSVATPKLVWCMLQAERKAWKEPDLAGSARKGFSNPHPTEMMYLLCEETENFVWTTVCKKRKKNPNFIKTELFSFRIVNLSINVTHVVV